MNNVYCGMRGETHLMMDTWEECLPKWEILLLIFFFFTMLRKTRVHPVIYDDPEKNMAVGESINTWDTSSRVHFLAND